MYSPNILNPTLAQLTSVTNSSVHRDRPYIKREIQLKVILRFD